MQTKTKPITYTFYICDNCGAEHKKDTNIHTDYVTGEEICDKCQTQVRLANRDIYYDSYDKSCGELYTNEYYVSKDLVQACEMDLDLDREVYLKRVAQIRDVYLLLMDKIDKEYLKGRVRDTDVRRILKDYVGK